MAVEADYEIYTKGCRRLIIRIYIEYGIARCSVREAIACGQWDPDPESD